MALFNLFVDTNVLLDAFLRRKAARDCKQILTLAEKSTVKLYTSPSCLLTMIYFLQKAGLPAKTIGASVADLLKILSLRSPDENDFLHALRLNFPDMEDAVQYQTALQIKGIDYFVTSNIKDLKKAFPELQVKTPGQFIDIINKQA